MNTKFVQELSAALAASPRITAVLTLKTEDGTVINSEDIIVSSYRTIPAIHEWNHAYEILGYTEITVEGRIIHKPSTITEGEQFRREIAEMVKG